MAVSAADNNATMFDESMLSSLPGMGSSLPVLGFNIDGGSVFSNYVKARKDGHSSCWGRALQIMRNHRQKKLMH